MKTINVLRYEHNCVKQIGFIDAKYINLLIVYRKHKFLLILLQKSYLFFPFSFMYRIKFIILCKNI